MSVYRMIEEKKIVTTVELQADSEEEAIELFNSGIGWVIEEIEFGPDLVDVLLID